MSSDTENETPIFTNMSNKVPIYNIKRHPNATDWRNHSPGPSLSRRPPMDSPLGLGSYRRPPMDSPFGAYFGDGNGELSNSHLGEVSFYRDGSNFELDNTSNSRDDDLEAENFNPNSFLGTPPTSSIAQLPFGSSLPLREITNIHLPKPKFELHSALKRLPNRNINTGYRPPATFAPAARADSPDSDNEDEEKAIRIYYPIYLGGSGGREKALRITDEKQIEPPRKKKKKAKKRCTSRRKRKRYDFEDSDDSDDSAEADDDEIKKLQKMIFKHGKRLFRIHFASGEIKWIPSYYISAVQLIMLWQRN